MKMSITTTLAWACLLCFSQQTLASTNDNDDFQPLLIDEVNNFIKRTPNRGWTLLQRIEYNLDKNGEANYGQRFGPLSKFTWSQIELATNHQFAADQARSEGKSYFTDTIGDSILSGFDSWFDFGRFKKVCSPALTFGAKFAEGSLDPREGRLQPESVEPGNVGATHSWMYTFLQKNKKRYGLKLLNSKPYIYYSRGFGENNEGMPIVITDTRLRLTLSNSHTKRLRVDESLIFPILDRAQLSIGFRLFPNEFNSRESRSSMTIKLSYQLDKFVNYDDIIYFSAQIDSDNQLFLVGFSLSKILSK